MLPSYWQWTFGISYRHHQLQFLAILKKTIFMVLCPYLGAKNKYKNIEWVSLDKCMQGHIYDGHQLIDYPLFVFMHSFYLWALNLNLYEVLIFSLHSFNEHYLSFHEYTISLGNRFEETHGTSFAASISVQLVLPPTHIVLNER